MAQLTLEMGYKEINRVIYTRRDMAGCHNDAVPEVATKPILSLQLSDIAPNPITEPT